MTVMSSRGVVVCGAVALLCVIMYALHQEWDLLEPVQMALLQSSSARTGQTWRPVDKIEHLPNVLTEDIQGSRIHIPPTPIVLSLKMPDEEFEEQLYQFYEYISYNCSRQVRMGNIGDGGWDVCLDPPYKPKGKCLVYSFGIKNDWSYDDDISEKLGCEVHSFDPSIEVENPQRSRLVTYHHIGLGGIDGDSHGLYVNTLSTIRRKLRHTHVVIDFLKIDIEKDEFKALPQMVLAGDFEYVKQLSFELHRDGRKYSTIIGYNLMRLLEYVGFRKFHYHKNRYCRYKSTLSNVDATRCHELYYINSNYLK